MPTAIGYLLTLVIILVKGGWDFLKRYIYLLIFVSAALSRELDFDSRFTTMGFFKIKFYLSTLVPF
jgi:hypothetical protein